MSRGIVQAPNKVFAKWAVATFWVHRQRNPFDKKLFLNKKLFSG